MQDPSGLRCVCWDGSRVLTAAFRAAERGLHQAGGSWNTEKSFCVTSHRDDSAEVDVYNPAKNEWDKIPAMLQVGHLPTHWLPSSVTSWLNLPLEKPVLSGS